MFAANGDDANTWEDPERILPRSNPDTYAENGILTAVLRRESWNVMRFSK